MKLRLHAKKNPCHTQSPYPTAEAIETRYEMLVLNVEQSTEDVIESLPAMDDPPIVVSWPKAHELAEALVNMRRL